MRYFLSIAFGFAGACLGWIGAFYGSLGGEGTAEAKFISEWYERKEAAAPRGDGPSFFVVGGSSGLFGVDTGAIREATDRNAVNFSTHAALSLDYLFQRAEASLEPGDMVLLMLEYGFYADPPPTDVMMRFVLGADPNYFVHLPLSEQVRGVLSDSFADLLGRWSSALATEKKNQGFVEEVVDHEIGPLGNRINHRADQSDRSQTSALEQAAPVRRLLMGEGILEPSAWQEIEGFLTWCRLRDIRVVVAFPPLLSHAAYASPKVDESGEKLRASFESRGVPVLWTLRESLLPSQSFFDSVYHLNEEAKTAFTKRLLVRLGPEFEQWKRNGKNP